MTTFMTFRYVLILYIIMHALIPPTDLEPATACLGPGAAVGISVTIFLVSFSAGALLATLITYCCCVRGKGESSGLGSGDLQSATVYDEVGTGRLELKENVAYGPVRR